MIYFRSSKAVSILGCISFAAVLAFGLAALRQTVTPPSVSAAPTAPAAAVTAAQAFLASRTPAQRAKAALQYDDVTKTHWHNLPPMLAKRPGITFSELSAEQKGLGVKLLRSVLGSYGYQKVTDITAADEFLGVNHAPNFPTGPNAYLLAVFGEPSLTKPWAIEYGGHHLGLNLAISGQQQVMAPTLTGAYPNIYAKDGKQIFVMHDEFDRAAKLVNSLSPEQRTKAISPTQIFNFVLGPGHDGQRVQPEGLKGSEMTASQKAMMLDVTAAWVNMMSEDPAKNKIAEIRRNLDDTYFLWSGNTVDRGLAYFRVQGPTVWIEYAPQTEGGPGSFGGPGGGAGGGAGGVARGPRPGGGPPPTGGWPPPDLDAMMEGIPNRKLDANHVHAVYREFGADYGTKFTATR